MASIEQIKGSDGSGNASLATIQNSRSIGATTIIVDTVLGINPAGFMGSMGTPHTFIDPVTSEEITVISEATAVDFSGHVDGSNLEIDTIAPGYTDGGSEVGDIVIIRPTTQYADNLADVLDAAHDDDGTLKAGAVDSVSVFAANVISSAAPFADAYDPEVRAVDDIFDHIASGCVWTADAAGSTRAASCTAGVVYIGGKRLTVAAVTARTFTASKDVYGDLKDNGDGTAVWVYYDNTTNAASPSFATTGGTVRGVIVVVGASSIAAAASINQGQFDRVLPIASSIPYTFTDSLGNIICPRDPQRKILGYRQVTSAFNTTSSSDITGLNLNCIIPSNQQVEVSSFCGSITASVANNGGSITINDVTASANICSSSSATNASSDGGGVNPVRLYNPPASGTRNFKAILSRGTNAATTTGNASATNPAYLMVKRAA